MSEAIEEYVKCESCGIENPSTVSIVKNSEIPSYRIYCEKCGFLLRELPGRKKEAEVYKKKVLIVLEFFCSLFFLSGIIFIIFNNGIAILFLALAIATFGLIFMLYIKGWALEGWEPPKGQKAAVIVLGLLTCGAVYFFALLHFRLYFLEDELPILLLFLILAYAVIWKIVPGTRPS